MSHRYDLDWYKTNWFTHLCINEIMSLIIQHEWYREFLSEKWLGRDIEQDAVDSEHEEEKHYG